MAGSDGGNGGTGGLIAGINVTPLVDVVLVLLIIFIVTARLVVAPNAALKLTLPTASTSDQVTPVFAVTLTTDGVTRIDGQPVSSDDDFLARAVAEHERHPDLRAVIQADGEVHHARVVKTMDLLSQAGVTQIAFAVQPERDDPDAMSPARRKGYVLKYRVPAEAVRGEMADGPYAIAARIGRYSAGWRWPIALATTLGIHAALAFLAYLGDREHRVVAPPPQQVVTLERPPSPAPEPPPPPPPPPRKPPPKRTSAPAAAQSGRVVTATPHPAEPEDLTSFAMPVGKSESYAGGLTAATGTSTVAVTDARASAHGVGGGSQARPASPARRDWACAWPEEEQSSDLHDLRVTIRVKVSETGRAEQVDVLSSPKDSFTQAARACAQGETFRPARNDAGQEVAGLTSPFAVHFVR